MQYSQAMHDVYACDSDGAYTIEGLRAYMDMHGWDGHHRSMMLSKCRGCGRVIGTTLAFTVRDRHVTEIHDPLMGFSTRWHTNCYFAFTSYLKAMWYMQEYPAEGAIIAHLLRDAGIEEE